MKREDVAWEYLTDLERAQLIHFYPELEEQSIKHGDFRKELLADPNVRREYDKLNTEEE